MTANPAIDRLEPGICDAALMAGIASTLVEEFLGCDGNVLDERRRDQLLFAVYQAQRLIEDHKAAFYRALNFA